MCRSLVLPRTKLDNFVFFPTVPVEYYRGQLLLHSGLTRVNIPMGDTQLKK